MVNSTRFTLLTVGILVHHALAQLCQTGTNRSTPPLEKWVDPLPTLSTLKPDGYCNGVPWYRIPMETMKHKFHRDLPKTTMWSFRGQFPGPVIEARVGEPVNIEWANDLPTEHILDCVIDPKLNMGPQVRNVVHMHGALITNTSDGDPNNWITPGNSLHYHYPNIQPPTFMFYHDHAHGITRINFYAGLVGLYFLRSETEKLLGLPCGKYEIPLMIEDRTFNDDGSIFYPVNGGTSKIWEKWVPAFNGDVPTVNGKIYPYLEVEPRKYRFRLINICNSRWLNLYFADSGPKMVLIGSDGGYLPHPVEMDNLLVATAERMDVLIDFTEYAGRSYVLYNDAPSPLPTVPQVPNSPLPEIMQFRVKHNSNSLDRSVIPKRLPAARLPSCVGKIRDLVLEETFVIKDNITSGPISALLNGLHYEDPITEKPRQNTIELWRIVDRTFFAHAIHLHQTQFKVAKRCTFDIEAWEASGRKKFDDYIGECRAPFENESGIKDTAKHFPGTVTYLHVPFYNYHGTYVWHCHMLEHEDNDMMRPFEILPPRAEPEKCIAYIEDL